MGTRLGGDITRAADLNQPKGYSLLDDVTLSSKDVKGEGKAGVGMPSQSFQRHRRTLLADGKWRIIFSQFVSKHLSLFSF